MRINTLSGRFLALTTVFVLLAELLILVPSLANFRMNYLEARLERAQIASLALLTTDEMIDQSLETELLENAGVYNVVLRRDEVRQLILASPLPIPISGTYDLRAASFPEQIADALRMLWTPGDRVIRVIGAPVKKAGQLIEVTTNTAPLRREMLEYGLRLLTLSALISVITALLLFALVRRLVLSPIRQVVHQMGAWASAPEDARGILTPSARVAELRDAEEALAAMQTQLTGSLRQKERLAQLGQAVAKISHDLRNVLTTAQLFADRLERSKDPAVLRAAPKLVGSITRAINLCETTLAFGRAEEPPPVLSRFRLHELTDEIAEAEMLASEDEDGTRSGVEFTSDVPTRLLVRADREQMFRVLSNLVRNARQAIEGTGAPGTIEIAAGEGDSDWWIRVGDTGPGLPGKTRDHLFQAFQGGSRKGGTGLGLAIASELVRNHGGKLELLKSDEKGTEFRITLPRGELREPFSSPAH